MLLLTYYMWTCACVCTHTHTHTHTRNRNIVLAAVQRAGTELQYAHADLQKDKQVVLAAVRNEGCALRYASEELQKDPELVFILQPPFPCTLIWNEGCALPRSSRHTHTQTDRQKHTHRLRRAPEGSWNVFSFSAPWCAGQCEGVDVACGLTTSSY